MKRDLRLYYYYWASLRGVAIEVIPKHYLGLRGYNGYIQVKEHEGIKYAGEVWNAITIDGDPIQAIFRIPYDDIGDRKFEQCDGDRTDELLEYTNYHTDGIKAFMSGRNEDIDRTQLLTRSLELDRRISNLKQMFDMLRNNTDQQLKLGIQLYLRRLENPNRVTSREWRDFTSNNSNIRDQIIELCK